MDFRGKAKRIEDIDIPRIGAKIGVGEDELHAFMDVEARGSGFDPQGRPKMLFEPHVFYRNLKGKKRDEAVRQGLAYPKWGTKPYPKDSYQRLGKALAIDENAALKAASWGLGQILGENYKLVGYTSPKAMVQAFMDDEETHLEAIVQYLISTGLDDELREHRWDAVAYGYNGPGHAKHDYAGRMRERFKWWQGKKDTPWEPEIQLPPEIELPPLKPEPTGSPKPTPTVPSSGGQKVKDRTMKMKFLWGGLVFIAVIALILFFTNNGFSQEVEVVAVDGPLVWLMPYLEMVVGTLITALIGWAAARIHAATGINIEAKHREALQSALANGARLALNRTIDSVKAEDLKIGNPAMDIAIRYALESVPDAINYFGLTPNRLRELLLPKLLPSADTVVVKKK